ncbi:MAG: lipopolysaccharide biosynthesis protein [Saprospiraceae bacterium]|nr:lipopolysaccharide biosynthesis protein [Saprospiraceae bacterium]MBK8548889.1 lipopolysaccharide biosynthesis protein [Saprospiraceae bacterium]MBK8853525.1 lipopolysaccharide biosynthesis protein [Saprospiraceae bacterium]
MKTNKHLFKSVFMKGLRWSFLSTAVVSVLSVLYYALLTRYLTPDDFGLFSVGLIFIGFMEFFSGAGVSAILIQEKKVSDEQFSTFFWINLLIGLFFSLLLVLIAPVIAVFFKDEKLVSLLYILSAAPVLNAAALLHNNILRREIQIAVSEKIEIIANIVQISSGIYLAKSGYTFISLPLAFVFSRLVSCIGYLWAGIPYFKPSFIFRYDSVKNQLSLGSYVVFERFFNYLKANIDKFLIGRFLGTESLGYYSLAQKIIDYPLSKINPGLNKVLFPYFSRLQERPKIISKLYSNVITFLTFIVTPVLLFVILFAEEIVIVLFDTSYSNIAVLIQILSVLGLLKSFSNIGGNVLIALGKFKVGFYWNLIWSLVLTLTLLVSLQYNINLTEFTLVVFFANFASFFVWHGIILKYINIPYINLTLRFSLVFVLSFLFVYLLKSFIMFWPSQWPQSIMLGTYFSLLVLVTAYFTLLLLKNQKTIIFTLWK